jgi:hypothetical protein
MVRPCDVKDIFGFSQSLLTNRHYAEVPLTEKQLQQLRGSILVIPRYSSLFSMQTRFGKRLVVAPEVVRDSCSRSDFEVPKMGGYRAIIRPDLAPRAYAEARARAIKAKLPIDDAPVSLVTMVTAALILSLTQNRALGQPLVADVVTYTGSRAIVESPTRSLVTVGLVKPVNAYQNALGIRIES